MVPDLVIDRVPGEVGSAKSLEVRMACNLGGDRRDLLVRLGQRDSASEGIVINSLALKSCFD